MQIIVNSFWALFMKIGSKEAVIKDLVETYGKTEDEAQKLVEKYW